MEFCDVSEINSSEDYTAVYITDLCKRYGGRGNGKELVLNKFCMRVRKGSIYAFLGSSGCGKTTVLSCIVGLRSWESGQVLVFGKEPGSKESEIPGKILGYMPQELALYNQLSIMETMIFYGRLYGMSDSATRNQWKVLSELLNLSNAGSKLIGELSGGQKRRASLAVAMIHSPELLVLDEPTVGLDPILRENIWNYLCDISGRFKTTIIITTHYFEEARYSDKIGFMRRGRMLVEEKPSKLLNHYGCDLLEQVVMKICRLDQRETGTTVGTVEKRKAELKQSENLTFNCYKLKNELSVRSDELEGEFRLLSAGNIEKGFYGNQSLKNKSELDHSNSLLSLRKTIGFAWVIFIIFSRYPVFFLSILMMPALQGTITLLVSGSKPIGLPFGIINHEVSDWTTACESTKNHTYIESKLISDCQLTSNLDLKILSCQYLKQLKNYKIVKLLTFSSEEEARVQVDLGNCWGYLIIPENFSQDFSDLLFAKQYATNESIEGSRIPIYLENSEFISSLFIIRTTHTSYSNVVKELAKSCSMDEKMVDLPLKFREPIYGDNEDNYTTFVMPGLLLFTLFGVVSSLSELLLIEGRRQGTLSRATVAGLSCSNVILSHIIVQGVLTIAQLIIWNIVLYFIFSIPFNGQVWLYVLICLLTGLSGTTFGIFLGLVLSTEVQALYAGSFLMNVLIFYGGIIWPTEAMTKFWQTAGSILPTYLPAQSLRSVIVRGVGITHPLVWPGILASVFWTIGLVVIIVIIYRKKT